MAAIPVTPESNRAHANALLRAGRNDNAVALLESWLRAATADHAAWHLLSVAHTQCHRHAAALKAIRRALALAPQETQYQKQHGFTLVNLMRFDAAISVLLPLVRALPDAYAIMRGLHVAYYKAGKQPHALALGRRLLTFADNTLMSIAKVSPAADIMSLARGDARVVSFTLVDADPKSALGASANTLLAQRHYPGWKCRFYVGQTVPPRVTAALQKNGAEIIDASRQYPHVPPALWANLVADDPGVAVFLCRSSSARLSEKEAAAVAAWLHSGRRAHVMRDHILHRNLVLPGLWGARTDNPLFVEARIQRFMAAYGNPPSGREQRFLDSEIWPAIRGDSLIHDSYYPLFNAQPFPTMGKGDGQSHVGMGVAGTAALRREAASLGLPWPQA